MTENRNARYEYYTDQTRAFLHVLERCRWHRSAGTLFVLVIFNLLARGQETIQQSNTISDIPVVQANPGRPTVSTPATLTPVGYLQFESGVLGAEKSSEFSNRTGIETVAKLSLTRRFELVVQTEPIVVSDLGNRTDQRPGEVFTGFQTVIKHGERSRPTISVSYFRRLYASPAPELDIGTNRQSALLLVSFDLKKCHVDTNGIVTEQISDQTGSHRAQFGQTLSISRPVRGNLSFSGELWHFSQPLTKSNSAGLLLAPSYSVNRFLVLDGGINRGLTTTSTRWEIFVGFTYLFPKKLWD